jgi:hypothetical protein
MRSLAAKPGNFVDSNHHVDGANERIYKVCRHGVRGGRICHKTSQSGPTTAQGEILATPFPVEVERAKYHDRQIAASSRHPWLSGRLSSFVNGEFFLETK